MELRDGKVSGSYYALSLSPNQSVSYIPLFFSKYHAQKFFNQYNLDTSENCIRGLPRYCLRAFIIELEWFEKREKLVGAPFGTTKSGGAMIFFDNSGQSDNIEFMCKHISYDRLAKEYYCDDVPSIEKK